MAGSPDDPRRDRASSTRALLAAAIAAAAGLALVAWFFAGGAPPVDRPEPPAAAIAEDQGGGMPPLTPTSSGAAPPELSAPRLVDPLDDPASAASAHAAIAAELNLVGVRCPLPPGLPTEPPVGAFQAAVVDGWFSDIVQSLEGERGAELRFGPPGAEPGHPDLRFELAYIVSWKAERWGETVRCSVRPVQRGTLVVAVSDEDGGPFDGVAVHGCGRNGSTVGGRVELTDVIAGDPCTVRARWSQQLELCVAQQSVTVPPGGRAQVDLTTRCGSLLDPEVQAREQAYVDEIRASFRGEADYRMDYEAELALFTRMRAELADGTPGADVIRGLIAHREFLMVEKRRADARLEALMSPDPEVRDAAMREMRGQE